MMGGWGLLWDGLSGCSSMHTAEVFWERKSFAAKSISSCCKRYPTLDIGTRASKQQLCMVHKTLPRIKVSDGNKNNTHWLTQARGSGCGTVGREVASDLQVWIHQSVNFIYYQLWWKDENKEKEAGNGPILRLKPGDVCCGVVASVLATESRYSRFDSSVQNGQVRGHEREA